MIKTFTVLFIAYMILFKEGHGIKKNSPQEKQLKSFPLRDAHYILRDDKANIVKYKIFVLQQKLGQVSPNCIKEFCHYFGKKFWTQIKEDIANHKSSDIASDHIKRKVEAWWSKFKV